MRLVIGMATRGRPALLASTIEKTLVNLTDPETRLLVSLDEDDHESIGVIKVMAGTTPVIVPHIEPRPDTVAEKWNQMLTLDAGVYLLMCDDGPIVTKGFDSMVIEAASLFPDGIGVVTNRLENLTFPGLQAPTKRLCELMGYFYPPYFPYWFVDHWLLDITRMIGRDVYVDVVNDCTVRPPTMEFREPWFWANVYDLLRYERRRIALRIIDEMDDQPWRKKMLISHFPHWEDHSRMINDIARRNYARQAGPEPDERYLRLKRKMAPMLREALDDVEHDAWKKPVGRPF